MSTIRLAFCLLGLVAVFSLAPAAHALDDSGAKLVIAKFLASQKSEQGTASAGQHVISDLDGDGKPDIVLLWDVLGPTSSWPKLTVFLDQGRTYRALTTDLTGQIEKLTVKGPSIVVNTLMPGPNDARCCPTIKKQLRFRWTGGKLTLEK